MSIDSILSVAGQGMRAQEKRAATAASNIANQDTQGYRALKTSMLTGPDGGVIAQVSRANPDDAGGNDVDLAGEMTELMQAETAYKANAAAFETGADMWEVLKTIVR